MNKSGNKAKAALPIETYPRTPSAHPRVVFDTPFPMPLPAPDTPFPTAFTAPPAALPTPATQPCTFLEIQLSFAAMLGQYVGFSSIVLEDNFIVLHRWTSSLLRCTIPESGLILASCERHDESLRPTLVLIGRHSYVFGPSRKIAIMQFRDSGVL